MSQPLPTIVFFPGAFADPSCFDTFAPYFQDAGYPTRYAYTASLNPPDPTTVSTSKDGEEARKRFILPLLDGGKDVVVLVHSYGGVVGGQAAAGLSKRTRSASGKPGGIVGLIYLVGNIQSEAETLFRSFGASDVPFVKQDYPSKGLCVIDPVMETLYGDVDPALAPELEAAMIPHAVKAFETPASAPAWAESAFDGRRAYIRTLDDQTLPLMLQNTWLGRSGVEWDVVDLKSGHCPFITCPEKAANIAIDFIKKWI